MVGLYYRFLQQEFLAKRIFFKIRQYSVHIQYVRRMLLASYFIVYIQVYTKLALGRNEGGTVHGRKHMGHADICHVVRFFAILR